MIEVLRTSARAGGLMKKDYSDEHEKVELLTDDKSPAGEPASDLTLV